LWWSSSAPSESDALGGLLGRHGQVSARRLGLMGRRAVDLVPGAGHVVPEPAGDELLASLALAVALHAASEEVSSEGLTVTVTSLDYRLSSRCL